MHGVRFGLRQQLLVDLESFSIPDFTAELDKLAIAYQVDANTYPNIVSSYPAADAFIRDSWLSEDVYKEVLGSFDYEPAIKVNILATGTRAFTPMLTGNINWIASASVTHYWHLIIRFPKTNVIHEWNMLTHTNEISRVTKALEQIMTGNASRFIDNPEADGEQLFAPCSQKRDINSKRQRKKWSCRCSISLISKDSTVMTINTGWGSIAAMKYSELTFFKSCASFVRIQGSDNSAVRPGKRS